MFSFPCAVMEKCNDVNVHPFLRAGHKWCIPSDIMSSYLPNWTNFYSFRRRMSEYFSWIWTLVVQWLSCARYSIVCMVGKDVRSYCWFQVWSSTTTPWSYRLITKASAIHSMSGSHTDGTLNNGGIYPRRFMEIKLTHAAVKRWQHSSMELLPYSHFQLLMTDMYKQKVEWSVIKS